MASIRFVLIGALSLAGCCPSTHGAMSASPLGDRDGFRFSYANDSGGVGAVRVQLDGDGATVEKRTLFEPTRVCSASRGVITQADWVSVVSCFEEAGFWTAPAEAEDRGGCFHGEAVTVERRRGGQMHRTFLPPCTDSPVAVCVQLIRRLARGAPGSR